MGVSERLKALRSEQRLEVPELAERSGVSKAYIWQIESGRRKSPSGEVLVKLAAALGTTISDVLGLPQGMSAETLSSIPPTLNQLVKTKGKKLGMRAEDVEMLKQIHFRGRRPRNKEDWELIFLFLKRILG